MTATGSRQVETLPAWKFDAPQPGAVVLPRARLVEKIEQVLGRTRSSGNVCLLIAPAGYGKSTLAFEWARASGMPVAWYHFDAGDHDPATLICGLVHALRGALGQSKWEAERIVTRTRGGTLSPVDARRAIDVLVQDIGRNVQAPATLVLSNVGELHGRDTAYQILDRLFNRPPDHLRILLESREATRFRLSALVTQHRMGGLGIEDLKLRDDEFDALLHLTGSPLSDGLRETLRTLCDGWVTGVLLATGSLVPECLARYPDVELDRDAIFDYLANEVIDALPDELREAAMECALLRYVTPSLCSGLFGLADARSVLAQLEQRTGFVSRTGRPPDEPTYTFQPFFQQALLDRLALLPDSTERQHYLHARAGALLEEQGDCEEAAWHYDTVQRYDLLVAMIEARRGALLRGGRGATLARWLDMLPQAVLDEQPHLQVLLAELLRQAGRTGEAQVVAERACQRCLVHADREPELYARAMVTRASVSFTLGNYDAARGDCRRALDLAPRDAAETQMQARFILTACLAAAGELAEAQEVLDGAEERATRQRDPWARARLHYLRAKLAIARGDFASAEEDATLALRLAEEANDEIDAINSRINLGSAKSATGRYDEARLDLEAARRQAEEISYPVGQVYALTNLARVEIAEGRFGQALTLCEEAILAVSGVEDHYLRAQAYAAMAYVLVAQHAEARAVELLTPVLQGCPMDEYAREWVTLAVPAAIAYARSGTIPAALETLATAAAWTRTRGLSSGHAKVCFALAIVRMLAGDEAGAQAAAGEALRAAAATGGTWPLIPLVLAVPEVLAPLRAIEHPLMVSLRATVERVASPTCTSGCTETASPPEAPQTLRVYLLGEARVFIGDRHVTKWRMTATRDFFYYLLDHGGSARKEAAIDALWEERELKSSDNTFRQVRYQLKQALGVECLEQDGQRWRLKIPCSVDVEEFQHLATAGLRAADDGHLDEAADALHRALELYKGPYLEDVYADWATSRRDELHRLYLASLERLAEVEAARGKALQSVELYRTLLNEEPFRESAHRGIMRYYLARGELAQALTQYKRCLRVLDQELGAAPDPATKALRDLILKSMQPVAHPTASA